nr:phosphatidylcholine translocator ABCB4-like [Halyomorpha halys]
MPPENESAEVPRFRNLDVAELSASPSSEGSMKNQNIFSKGSNREIYEIQPKEKKKKFGKFWTILKIFHYANKKDTIILILSFLAAVGNGIVSPINVTVLLTPLLTIFIEVETPGNPQHVNMTVESSRFAGFGYKYFIFGALNFIFGFIQIMASELAARNIMCKIKTAYLAKMLSIEIGWYDKSQEQFVSTVSYDLQKMMVLFDSKMTSAAEMLSFLVFGCLAGLLASWKVAILTLGLMVIAMAIMYYIMQASKKKGKLRQQYSGKCTKIASEVLGNARTVGAYGGEYKEIKRYGNTFKLSNKYGLQHATVISMAKAFNYFQLCICYSVAYYFSVRLFLNDDFNPGNIAIILIAQINAVYHSTIMLSTISDLFMATDSAYRVMQFLDTETSYKESIEQGVIPDTFEADISFKNVQFSYPTNLQTKVLHDLTLDIEPGKVTAVVGTSGAGKSTVVGLTSRLYDVTAGQILIGGVDIRKLNVGWLRNQIGVVGQEPTLFDTTIEENIRYGKTTATLEEIIEASKISHAHSFIEKLPSGYGSIVGERGAKLSGGQKQRIAIARAIVRKPKLLLLDEATSALDSRSEVIVQKALDNAMRDRTTVIIAHRMSTVRKADVIYAMKDGHVLEKGSHNELMELQGYYYSLVKVQEIEEKDKAVTLDKGTAHKEELIEEDIPFDDDYNLEEPEDEKKLKLSKKNLKVMGVWLLAILFAITTSAFLPTFYGVFSLFCQSYTYGKGELNQIALIDVGILFGLGVVSFFSVVLSGMMATIATQIWLKKLQIRAFNKIVSMDISWFDRSGNSPNECLEVLTNSPPLIESVTGDRAAQVVIFMLSLVFCLAFSLFISTNVTLANLPIILVFIIINCLRMKPRKSDTRSASLATRSTKVATEYVENVKTIQLLNCQKYVIDLYEDMLVHSKKEAFVSIIWYAVVYGLSKSLIRFSMGTTFIYGAHDIATGNVRGTALIGIVAALSTASMLAGPALILMSQYPAARQAIIRLYRIAYTKTSVKVLTDEGAKPDINGNIVFQDIIFSYPTRDNVQILKKLNLKIEAGKTVALVGDSGCGKSTIISLLERFYLPNGGKIMIDGNDINDINVRYLRSQMGLVSQEPVLFDMTIKENILYGLEEEVTMDNIIEAAKIANIHDFIMKLPQAYDTSVGERGSKLSGGQKQRIAIARAVLRNPKILLLDEATSALDTESEKAVQEALENASVGKTTIVIAHRLSTIREADKIVVLQSGVVIEEGNHEELIEKRGHYFNLLNR